MINALVIVILLAGVVMRATNGTMDWWLWLSGIALGAVLGRIIYSATEGSDEHD